MRRIAAVILALSSSQLSPTGDPVNVTNTAVGKAVAVRCVNTSGNAFEACGGGSSGGNLGWVNVDGGTIAVSNFPASQAVTNAGLSNLDVALSTRTKPADQQHTIVDSITAGSNIIGKVGVDQTTPGTTNGVSISHVGSTAVATGNGTVGAGVQRVAIASDNTTFPVTATCSQATGTNLHVVTDATSTTAIAAGAALIGKVGIDQTTPGTTNAVSVTNSFALDATLTGGNAVCQAKSGAKGATAAALLTSTAEGADHQAIDVQIYSGGTAKDPTSIRALTSADTVTAVSGTAANFLATASQGGTWTVQPGNTANTTAWKVDGSAVTQPVNVSQVSAAAVATAASGVQKVGIVGNIGAAFDAANNAAPPANVIAEGWETISSGTQPTAATSTNIRRPLAGLDGAPFVRLGGPVSWSCGLSAIGATLTECQAAPAAGLSLYLTDIFIMSDTATAGNYTLRFGTGTNCGTGTTTFFPKVASLTTGKIVYPVNTALVAVNNFITPIKVTAANAICIICIATQTCTVTMNGYTAP